MITCKNCGEPIADEIIADLHVDGFDDDDIICNLCTTKMLAAFILSIDGDDKDDDA